MTMTKEQREILSAWDVTYSDGFVRASTSGYSANVGLGGSGEFVGHFDSPEQAADAVVHEIMARRMVMRRKLLNAGMSPDAQVNGGRLDDLEFAPMIRVRRGPITASSLLTGAGAPATSWDLPVWLRADGDEAVYDDDVVTWDDNACRAEAFLIGVRNGSVAPTAAEAAGAFADAPETAGLANVDHLEPTRNVGPGEGVYVLGPVKMLGGEPVAFCDIPGGGCRYIPLIKVLREVAARSLCDRGARRMG